MVQGFHYDPYWNKGSLTFISKSKRLLRCRRGTSILIARPPSIASTATYSHLAFLNTQTLLLQTDEIIILLPRLSFQPSLFHDNLAVYLLQYSFYLIIGNIQLSRSTFSSSKLFNPKVMKILPVYIFSQWWHNLWETVICCPIPLPSVLLAVLLLLLFLLLLNPLSLTWLFQSISPV